jgi:hypothetical protein
MGKGVKLIRKQRRFTKREIEVELTKGRKAERSKGTNKKGM